MMADFHFLRPWWLASAVPAALLAWRLHRIADAGRSWKPFIAPHLLPHLLTGKDEHRRFNPVLLAFISWMLAVVALAGPSWQREPAPFADDSASLAIALKVTPSMQAADVQPTRQARAVEKIRDLLERRPGAKTALFAYAGSAHRVMPFTNDAGIVASFAEELSPDVMPKEGAAANEALAAAAESVKASGQPGWILWIADGATPAEAAAIKAGDVPVSVLVMAGPGPERDSLVSAAKAIGAQIVLVTPDDSDIDRLVRNATFSPAAESAGGDRWRDAGYWLVPVLVLLSLLWFRRGWALDAGGRS
jgi:Ca-activated chloride channel family protein